MITTGGRSTRGQRRGLCGQSILIAALAWACLYRSVDAGSWEDALSLGGFTAVDVYTPESRSPVGSADSHSLLIVLHGCVQPTLSYRTANLEVAAEEYGMVIAVPDAVYKEGFGCWAYWSDSRTGRPSRTRNDYGNLIDLARTLTADADRNIDADQVYIAGLSSGAAFAHTTACLAPDIFSGVGVSAGPSIGTSAGGALGTCESADVASRCVSYAGGNSGFLDTQISSLAQADDDTTVNTCYNTRNAEGMATVYGVRALPGSNTLGEGSNRATETLWQDGRVSRLWFHGGVGHAWSGGAGASGAYISPASINYASYLGRFFSTYNRRVDRNLPPEVGDLTVTVTGSVVSISVGASDTDGSVERVTATVTNALTGRRVDEVSLTVGGARGDVFRGETVALEDGSYEIAVVAVDDGHASSQTVVETVRVGEEPEPAAPVLSDTVVSVNGRCATLSGTVVDVNRDLDRVMVTFASSEVEAAVTGKRYRAEACELPGGVNGASVVATDRSGLTATDSVTFEIDAGRTATIGEHIDAGRLDYTGYANCYLVHGFDEFTLTRQVLDAARNTCRWQGRDTSCQGPVGRCDDAG